MGWVGLCWVGLVGLGRDFSVLGWVGQSADGLGWIGSHKMYNSELSFYHPIVQLFYLASLSNNFTVLDLAGIIIKNDDLCRAITCRRTLQGRVKGMSVA